MRHRCGRSLRCAGQCLPAQAPARGEDPCGGSPDMAIARCMAAKPRVSVYDARGLEFAGDGLHRPERADRPGHLHDCCHAEHAPRRRALAVYFSIRGFGQSVNSTTSVRGRSPYFICRASWSACAAMRRQRSYSGGIGVQHSPESDRCIPSLAEGSRDRYQVELTMGSWGCGKRLGNQPH